MASRKIEIAADDGKLYIAGSYSMPSTLTRASGAQTLAIMVHGFPGNSEGHDGLFKLLEKELNSFGMHSLSFDFRGCGHSEGALEDFTLAQAAEDLRLVLEWADHQMFEEIILIGEGLGAHLCLHADNPKTKAMIFFWPVVDLADYARRNFKADTMLENADDGQKHADIAGQKISLTLLREMVDAGLVEPPALKIPVLAQYGMNDEIIPPEHHIDKLKDMLEARRLDITGYQEGKNGLNSAKHRQTMVFHLDQFIEKYG